MSWWGKLAGGAVGFMLGGPLGALIGVALGHNIDTGMRGLTRPGGYFQPGDRERVQAAFFTATFSVMGHLAKADGQVSQDEIQLAENVMTQMSLTQEMRTAARRLFNEGKEPGFQLDDVLDQFRRECHRRHTLVQMFLEIQLGAAYADGSLDQAEERILLHICERLGFSVQAFRRLEEMLKAQANYRGVGGMPPRQGPSLNDAYALLGVSSDVSDNDLKRAYRRLMSQHHPDKLVSKGLPEEMVEVATQKTKEIQQAYETVKESRQH